MDYSDLTRANGRIIDRMGRMRAGGLVGITDREIERFVTVGAALADLLIGGRFIGQHIRNGEVIDEWEQPNLIVNEGLDYILSAALAGGQQITSFYMGLFGGNYSPVSSDAAANFAASAQETTTYQGTQRLPWQSTEAQQLAGNANSPCVFTFNASSVVYGGFLISSQQQGSTAGKLIAAAQFSKAKSPDPQDQLSISYVIAAQSASS